VQACMARALLIAPVMNDERIDFISAYCDRWCKRCTFTDRCSAYACHVAIAMCGDPRQGIELAVGRPRSPGGHGDRRRNDEPTPVQRLLEEYVPPSEKEMAEFERIEKERDARVYALPITRMSDVYQRRALDWIDPRRETFDTHPDPAVREAFAVVSWDVWLVGAKLHRALDGRDRFERGEEAFDDDSVQSDWNGSAKVALISIGRSAEAWRTLGRATGDHAAAALGDALDHLHRTVRDAFPEAMAFMRPGFDDPAEQSGD